MFRNSIAIFFTVLMMALVSAPTVLTVIDDSIDISMFYSMSEEEEKECKIKVNLQDNDTCTRNFLIASRHTFKYHFKNYATPFLNTISPPPEYNIL